MPVTPPPEQTEIGTLGHTTSLAADIAAKVAAAVSVSDTGKEESPVAAEVDEKVKSVPRAATWAGDQARSRENSESPALSDDAYRGGLITAFVCLLI